MSPMMICLYGYCLIGVITAGLTAWAYHRNKDEIDADMRRNGLDDLPNVRVIIPLMAGLLWLYLLMRYVTRPRS